MKRSFAVVTDSTADLPDDWRKRYDIEVVPLKVLFGEETFRDGVDMNNEAFFARLNLARVGRAAVERHLARIALSYLARPLLICTGSIAVAAAAWFGASALGAFTAALRTGSGGLVALGLGAGE